MADTPWSIFSPFSQTIGRFNHDPMTNWQRFFNPQIIFNSNPDDEGVEAHVLGKVGSYGSQLSTLIDAIEALKNLSEGKEKQEDNDALKAFDKLRCKAKNAVKEYNKEITPEGILAAVKALKKRDEEEAKKLKEQIESLF